MATINDVCKMTGVSKATVSRAINGTGQVKESTRQAIFAAMEQLNFRPNMLAQALASKTGNSIGLVLSDFDGNYFGQLLKSASRVADETGKQLIVTDGHNRAEREKQAIYSLVDRRCDVLIVYTREMSKQEMIAVQQEVGLPIIYLGRTLPPGTGYSVSFDKNQAAWLPMNHLLSLGHRNIAYFGPPSLTPTGIARMGTYREMLAERGIVFQEEWYQSCQFGLEDGYKAAQRFLASGARCSALFAASDTIAIGAMHAFKEAGLSLPRNMSVASIDDEELALYQTPSLTSAYLPVNDMIQHAMTIALKLMEGIAVPLEPKVFQGELRVRQSTMPPLPHHNTVTSKADVIF